jgi:hypothetical protein
MTKSISSNGRFPPGAALSAALSQVITGQR